MADNSIIQGEIFSKDIVEEIQEDLIKLATEGIQQETISSFKDLKEEAFSFLNKMDNLYKVFEQNQLNKLKQMAQNAENSKKIFDTTKKDKDLLLRSKYLLAFSFDAKVKNFLGQVPSKALYVHTFIDKETNHLDLQTEEMDLTDLISLLTSTTGSTGNEIGKLISKSGELPKDQTEEGKLLNQDNGKLEKHVEHARIAYIGTYNRLQRFFERRKAAGKDTYINKKGEEKKKTRQGGIILWKLQKAWTVGKVSNEGDLKEAYVKLLMAKHENDLVTSVTGKSPFYNHELVGQFFQNYIWNVTNKSAILEEDVVGENSQWAVKSYNASMPSLKQYITAARAIINADPKNVYDAETLKALLESKFPAERHRNRFEELNKKTKGSLTKALRNSVANTKGIHIEVPEDYLT